MTAVTRDRVIVFGIVGVLVVLALAEGALKITSSNLLFLVVAAPSIILHEVSHGVAALSRGDDTALKAGRLTLNPLRHVDLFGTLLLPLLLAVTGHAVFGYAKPVPVNPRRMKKPRDDAVLVSLAGPATNIALAIVAGLWLRSMHPAFLSTEFGPLLPRAVLALGEINVFLAVFNLIPVPPLDGSSVVGRFLPQKYAQGWAALQRWGMWIVLGLVLLDPTAIGRLFDPAIRLWAHLLQ